MDKTRYLLAALIALGLIAGCGDDSEDGNNGNNGDDTGISADAGDTGGTDTGGTDTGGTDTGGTDTGGTDTGGTDAGDTGGADADVAEAEPNDEAETATAFDLGQAIGGTIAEGSADTVDYDYFSFEATAGTIVEFGFASTGAGFDDGGTNQAYAVLLDEGGSISRGLAAADADSRQAFLPYDGTYYVVVVDQRAFAETPPQHGGAESSYVVTTAEVPLSPASIDVGGEVSDDLSDGAVDTYAFTPTDAGLLAVEVVAGRDPVASDLDSVVYIWNADAATLVAMNDDLDAQNDIYDSLARFQADADTNYVAIVDAYGYVANADYTLSVAATDLDDAPDAPRELAVGDSPVTGTIAAAAADTPDRDFFSVTLDPGQTVRVEVVADDAAVLEPHVAAITQTVFGPSAIAVGRPVDGTAAIEFAHPTSAESAGTYALYVDDLRNIPVDENDTPDNVGGPDFGYAISVADTTWTADPVDLPITTADTIATVGDTVFYEFTVPADSVLGFDVATQAADFEPVVGFLADGVFSGATVPGAGVYTAETTVVAGVRDAFFRGGTGYDFTPWIQAVAIPAAPNAVAEVEPNDDQATGQDLTAELPAAVSATIEGATAADLQPDVFAVTLTAGQALAVYTAGDGDGDPANDADTVLTLVDADGNTIATNDDFPGQPDGEYFSALAYQADADGVVYARVEPYCGDSGDCGGNGSYTLNVIVE